MADHAAVSGVGSTALLARGHSAATCLPRRWQLAASPSSRRQPGRLAGELLRTDSRRPSFVLHNARGAAAPADGVQPAGAHKAPPDDATGSDTLEGREDEYFEEIAGQYQFNKEQMQAFMKLNTAMRSCAFAFSGVAVSSVLLQYLKEPSKLRHAPLEAIFGLSIGNLSFWLDSVLLAALLWVGSRSFKRLIDSGDNQNHMAFAFQGLTRLGVLMQQLACGALAVGVVQALQAAAMWPPIARVGAAVFFAAAGIRCGALFWLMAQETHKHEAIPELLNETKAGSKAKHLGWAKRQAVRIVAGSLLVYTQPHAGQGGDRQSSQAQQRQEGKEGADAVRRAKGAVAYKLRPAEEQILRVTIDGLHTAGLALVVQALLTFLLAASTLAVDTGAAALAIAYGALNKALTAGVLFSAAQNFDAAIATEGADESHLLEGVGGGKGLASVFQKMTGFAWGQTCAQALQLAFPILARTPPFGNVITLAVTPRLVQLTVALQEGLLRLLGGI